MMASLPTQVPSCQVCGTQNKVMKRCTRCHDVMYWECQIQHWPEHKSMCLLQQPGHAQLSAHPVGKDLPPRSYPKSEYQQPRGGNMWTDGGSRRQRSFQDHHDEQDNHLSSSSLASNSSVTQTKTRMLYTYKDKPPVAVVKENLRHSQNDDITCLSNGQSESPPSKIDFQGASQRLRKDKAGCETNSVDAIKASRTDTTEESGQVSNYYLHKNVTHYDLPEVSDSCNKITVTLRSNHVKYKVDLDTTWSGSMMMKWFASVSKVPVEKLKVIHKGKVMTDDILPTHVHNKAVLQVVGEQAENEEGIASDDVNLLMKQLSVDRNSAVRALRKTDSLVDAIFQAAN